MAMTYSKRHHFRALAFWFWHPFNYTGGAASDRQHRTAVQQCMSWTGAEGIFHYGIAEEARVRFDIFLPAAGAQPRAFLKFLNFSG